MEKNSSSGSWSWSTLWGRGCATGPYGYPKPEPLLEKYREQLGTIGVATGPDVPVIEFDGPLPPSPAGVLERMGQGASDGAANTGGKIWESCKYISFEAEVPDWLQGGGGACRALQWPYLWLLVWPPGVYFQSPWAFSGESEGSFMEHYHPTNLLRWMELKLFSVHRGKLPHTKDLAEVFSQRGPCPNIAYVCGGSGGRVAAL